MSSTAESKETKESKAMTPLPVPGGVTLARRYYLVFGLSSAGALLAFAAAPAVAPLAAALAMFGTMFAVYARLIGRHAWGQAYAAAAQQALSRGRFDEVAELHAKIAPHSLRSGSVARTVAVQKALLALFRGAPADAVSAVGSAVDPKVGIYTAQVERAQIANAHAVRALAHALAGDGARALVDADAAEAYAEAMPEALARARLARTVVVSRNGDMVALSEQLAKGGTLMLEHTLPRERALIRALRRMAHGRGRSVYREPSKPSDGNEPGAVAAWIAQVAPEAAPYAAEEIARVEAAPVEPVPAPVASPEGQQAVAASRRDAKQAVTRRRRRTIVIGGALLAALFSLVWQMFASAANHHAGHDPLDMARLGPLMGLLAVVMIAGQMTLQAVRLRRINRALLGAHRAAAVGDHAAADALVANAKKSKIVTYAAAAGVTAAHLAERRGEFARSARECDAAIARLATQQAATISATQLMPQLLAARGMALAAMGRREEADAERAALHASYAGYMHLPLADFRIQLANAARAGDLERAREVALQRNAELPVPLRDDLLADLVLALGPRGVAKDETERIAAELRDNPEVCAWIDELAPGLRGRLGAPEARVRVETATSTIDAPGAESGLDGERRHELDDRETEDVPAVVRKATLDF